MSLILDALKKAEAERRLGHAPTLATVSPWRVQRRGPRYAVLIAALVLAALFAAFVAMRWRGEQAPAAAKPPAHAAAQSPSPTAAEESRPLPPSPGPRATSPAPAPGVLPAAPAPRPRQVTDAVAARESERKPEQARDGRNAPEVPAQSAGRKPEPPARIETAPQKLPTVVPAPFARAPVDPAQPEAPVPQAEQLPPAAKLPPPPARFVSGPAAPATPAPAPTTGGLSNANRAALGDIKLTLHYYNADKQRRFVIINGDRYVEGDATPKGLKVTEIRVDGVVLEFQGESIFLPRSGN